VLYSLHAILSWVLVPPWRYSTRTTLFDPSLLAQPVFKVSLFILSESHRRVEF